MAQKKISQLTAMTALVGSDVAPVVQGGITKKATVEEILMVKSLTNIRWDDIRTPVTATKKGGASDPDFIKLADNGAGSQGVFAYAFDDALAEELYFTVQPPHGYKYGTDLLPHVHWIPADSGTGNVKWELEYIVIEQDQVLGNTTIITKTEALISSKKHFFTKFDDVISGAALNTLSAMILCRIVRTIAAADNYALDVFLLEIDFHYQIDSLGSMEELIK